MSGIATNQMAVLKCMQAGSCLTIDFIDTLINMSRRDISKATGKLISGGFLERVEAGCYQLTLKGEQLQEAGGIIKSGPKSAHTGKAKPRNSLRQRAWRCMPTLGKFTASQLLGYASDGTERSRAAALNNMQAFLRMLCGAGFVVELRLRANPASLTSNGEKRFRLVRNTGALPPKLHGKAPNVSVFDPNTGEVTPWRKK